MDVVSVSSNGETPRRSIGRPRIATGSSVCVKPVGRRLSEMMNSSASTHSSGSNKSSRGSEPGSKKRGQKRRTSDIDCPPSPASSVPSFSVSNTSFKSVESSSAVKKREKKKKRTKKLKIKTVSLTNVEAVDNVGQVAEEEYIVEKICRRKLIETEFGKKLHYHIKWKGWATAHNTWEPIENLDGCHDLVDAYEKYYREKKERRAREGPNAQISDFSDDDDDKENFSEDDHMEKTRKEIVVRKELII